MRRRKIKNMFKDKDRDKNKNKSKMKLRIEIRIIAIRDSRDYKRAAGFVHPNSTIRQCSNEGFGQSIINNLPNTIFYFFAQYV